MGMHTLLLSNQHRTEINAVQFGWEDCAQGHSFGPASRTYMLLHFVVSGKGKFTVGEHTYPVGPGEIFIIHPYVTTYYEADQVQPWSYIWVGFEAGVPLPSALTGDVLSLPGAEALFTSMKRAAGLEAGREAFLCGKIWELLSLAENYGKAGAGRSLAREYVNTAKTYLETEYMRGVSVTELAGRLGLDRSYFSGLFRKETGKSPLQYLTDYRLEKAAELLRDYGKTPGEAALSTGYSDVFSFSRMFKRHLGVSPTEYLQRTREKKAEK